MESNFLPYKWFKKFNEISVKDMGTIITAIILIVIILFAIRGVNKNYKNGNRSCGGNCSNCNSICNNPINRLDEKDE